MSYTELLHYRNYPSSTPLIAAVAIDGNELKATGKYVNNASKLPYFF
nr:hypothetical protein [Haliscomenobacter sp.]